MTEKGKEHMAEWAIVICVAVFLIWLWLTTRAPAVTTSPGTDVLALPGVGADNPPVTNASLPSVQGPDALPDQTLANAPNILYQPAGAYDGGVSIGPTIVGGSPQNITNGPVVFGGSSVGPSIFGTGPSVFAVGAGGAGSCCTSCSSLTQPIFGSGSDLAAYLQSVPGFTDQISAGLTAWE